MAHPIAINAPAFSILIVGFSGSSDPLINCPASRHFGPKSAAKMVGAEYNNSWLTELLRQEFPEAGDANSRYQPSSSFKMSGDFRTVEQDIASATKGIPKQPLLIRPTTAGINNEKLKSQLMERRIAYAATKLIGIKLPRGLSGTSGQNPSRRRRT